MYQISVCWVKSNYAFYDFGFLPKTLQNYYIFFKEQNFGALFLVFAAKLVKNYENANESYLKRINKHNLVSNQKTLIQNWQRDLHKH